MSLPREILSMMMPGMLDEEVADFTAEDWKLFAYRGKRNRRNKVAKASRKRNRCK